jgi:methionine-rich copper-binding protein CopC
MNSVTFVVRSAVVIALIGSGAATGTSSTPVSALPQDHAHLRAAPRTVTLTFAAPVNPKSATFKVYRFPLETMMVGDKPMTGAQMDVFAGQEARKMLALKSDTADRMDTGVVTSAPGSQVVIGLKPNLAPGVYVTAWKLSGAVQKTGFVHFHYANY